ncbi:MAG: hypothetical protein ACKO2Z_03600, partial [Sphaerospermopsis kisseleviana]
GSVSKEVDDWESPQEEVRKPSRRSNNRPQRPESREDDVTPRPRKRRPSADSPSRRERNEDEAIPTDYVPYKPLETPNEDSGNTNDFDDV